MGCELKKKIRLENQKYLFPMTSIKHKRHTGANSGLSRKKQIKKPTHPPPHHFDTRKFTAGVPEASKIATIATN